ncbi:hypothetical protein GGS23DRAFT_598787 [Durotheca rogersii]|uniref:uncharacterized protein n=1 Tax=Durotheca rogersii TaxID=419775 RepID=UPI00221EAB8B|nr:uncharacterized protein GGS23DRAFT_598787 [Durotheca rogersii]KAI5861264.1 hypothetical protein GGS23DRAFT_598787 [Durotheca rogersii]
MLDRAQTFPLRPTKTASERKYEAWMTAEVAPFSEPQQKRVCYPNLAPWRPRDGERQLNGDLEAVVEGLEARYRTLESARALRAKWSVKFEGARRRVEGSEVASVPTIMAVAWNEDDRGYGPEDEEPWAQACRDIVAFLRENDAANYGVEIVHWDQLDYQVVA